MKTTLEPALVAVTAVAALALVGSAALAPTEPTPPPGGPPAEIAGDGAHAAATATWIPGCPSGTLFGQEPELPPGDWHLGRSDANADNFRIEIFGGVTDPICGISWYGTMLGWHPFTGFYPCDEDPAYFNVSFFSFCCPPGSFLAVRTATLEATPTGVYLTLSSGEVAELKRWVMTFPCVDVGAAYLRIYSVGGNPGCYFYWLSSEADGSHIFLSDGSVEIVDWNLSFCLLAEGCGTSAAGGCYASNGSPFCDDPECCVTICDVDAFCCDVVWDSQCAVAAAELCGNCGASDAGNCYESNGSPGCDDLDCCATVCAADPFCCDVFWDVQCAITAGELCGNCGGADAGTCFADNDTPGCDDAGCCQIVCIVDPYCCNVEWDGACSDHAREMCEGACCLPSGGCLDDEPAGDCMAAGGTFHGVNESCSSVVCPFPQCPGGGSCYADNGSSGCVATDCCNIVCNVDSFCCTNFWDHLCADRAAELCGNCGGSDAGSCFEPNGSPGCNDADCCAAVCAIDDYCCDFGWDELCADEAAALCGQSCPCDHDGDGDIDVDDLLDILGAWGGAGGDCTGDGTTNVDDLLAALAGWGGCP